MCLVSFWFHNAHHDTWHWVVPEETFIEGICRRTLIYKYCLLHQLDVPLLLLYYLFWLSWVFVAPDRLALLAAAAGCSPEAVHRLLAVLASYCGAQALCPLGSAAVGTGVASPQHVRHSRTRAGTQVPYIGRQIPNHWTTRQVPSLFSLANRTQFGLNNRLLCASWPLSQLQGGVCWLFKYNYGHLTTPASDWFRYVGVCSPGQWGVRQVCLVGGFWEKVPFSSIF